MTAVTKDQFPATARAAELSKRATEVLRKLPWFTEAQAAISWGILIALTAILGAIYLNQASQAAAIGRRIQILQNEFSTIKQINNELELEIAIAQELNQLESHAFALGFVKPRPEDIEYTVIPNYPNAQPTAQPAAEATVQPPPQTMRQVLWLLLKERVSIFTLGESYEP